MRIVNIMFSRGGGGIEQASVDYCIGLKRLGHEVTCIIYPAARVLPMLEKVGIQYRCMRNINEWDFFAIRRLRKLLLELKPEVILAHANRAVALSLKAITDETPLVGIAQNYNTRRFNDTDAVFTTTHDLIEKLERQGVSKDRIYHIPNMVECGRLPIRRSERQHPPVIGALGRFVAKKGFDIYIEALAILKSRGYVFKAVLGGQGEEEAELKALSARHGLADTLSFIGWVENKDDFYRRIDLFCLPSLHEPFGIVLLEAFAHGTPVIATDSEGPKDIITPDVDALIVPIGKAEPLADALAALLDHEERAENLAANAFVKVKSNYTIDAVCRKIDTALQEIVTPRRRVS